jgi:thiol:disulfide interchange protein DsbC
VEALGKSTSSAIKRVRGSGKRTIYTMEDPNCGYCKAFHKELAKVNDVTIYTFLWPILSPDSTDKSKLVWCAKDRAKAWDDLMTRGALPQNDGKCDTPLEKNKELAQRLGARGTPAVYLADGRQLPGMVPADKLEEALSTVGK